MTVHKRPANSLACNDTDAPSFSSVASKAAENPGVRFVDHRRVYDVGFDAGSVEESLHVRHQPGICRKRIKRCRFGRNDVAGRAEEPASARVNKFCDLTLPRKTG